jgi:hypothetical protein
VRRPAAHRMVSAGPSMPRVNGLSSSWKSQADLTATSSCRCASPHTGANGVFPMIVPSRPRPFTRRSAAGASLRRNPAARRGAHRTGFRRGVPLPSPSGRSQRNYRADPSRRALASANIGGTGLRPNSPARRIVAPSHGACREPHRCCAGVGAAARVRRRHAWRRHQMGTQCVGRRA